MRYWKKYIGVFFLLGGFAVQSYATGTATFGPHETKIEGSIKYTVLGRYVAHFNSFQGKITLDEKSGQVQSVYLSIDAGSIKSRHPRFDKLAVSRRLLNAAQYPKIIFKSESIAQDGSDYKVKGMLEMHGIRKEMIFPFRVRAQGRILDIDGHWAINRKDFNIIWNKYLDHGGIIVSDIFIVNWGINISLAKNP